MHEEILTVEQAAGLLKVPSETVIELLLANELPGRSIGGQWLTTKRALMSFVDGAPLSGMCCTSDSCCTPVAQAGGIATGRGCCC